ncbi:MAG: lamin tail domain-containing protein [Planctomycetota bacterium]
MKNWLSLCTLLSAFIFFGTCALAQEGNLHDPNSPLLESEVGLVAPGMDDNTKSASTQLRITEFMFNGCGGEFIELTNVGHGPIDMSGWSYDDASQHPGTVDLSGFGIIEAGESVILTEDDASEFMNDWGLVNVKVLRYTSGSLGENDQINIYSPTDQLIDCLSFGPDNHPGAVSANNHSAFPVTADIGTDNIYRWLLSRDGDVQLSYPSANNDIGNPGIVKYILAQEDLGYGGPGEAQFWVYGPKIATGNRVDVLLRRASAGQLAFLFLGLQNNPTSVLGGTVVPVPPFITMAIFTVPSDRCHYGEIYLKTDCGGGPATVFAQFVYVDPAQCLGYGFSNALKLDINP